MCLMKLADIILILPGILAEYIMEIKRREFLRANFDRSELQLDSFNRATQFTVLPDQRRQDQVQLTFNNGQDAINVSYNDSIQFDRYYRASGFTFALASDKDGNLGFALKYQKKCLVVKGQYALSLGKCSDPEIGLFWRTSSMYGNNYEEILKIKNGALVPAREPNNERKGRIIDLTLEDFKNFFKPFAEGKQPEKPSDSVDRVLIKLNKI